MGTVVLGWDPHRGPAWVPPFDDALAQSQRSGRTTVPWQLGPEPAPAPGTRVHLMSQGPTRGLVGRGTVRSTPYLAARAGQPGTVARYVLVEWDHLLPLSERIGTEELSARVPGVAWASLYGPLTELSPVDAERLERVWAAPHPSARPAPSRRRPVLPAPFRPARAARATLAHLAHVVHDALRDRAGTGTGPD